MWLVVCDVVLFLTFGVSMSFGNVQYSGCTFKRGECTYMIYMSDIDKDNCQRRSGEPLGLNDQAVPGGPEVQNDVVHQVQNIEKSFEQVKAKHEVRLKDLENSVRELLGMDKRIYDATKGKSGKKDSLDGALMTRLTNEFELLRKKLRRKESALTAAQLRVNQSETSLKDAQENVLRLNQQLSKAETRIATLGRERTILKHHLQDKTTKHETSLKTVNETNIKVATLEGVVERLMYGQRTLNDKLSQCRALLNASTVDNQATRSRYAELRRRHDLVKRELRVRERELISCYSAKTSAFCGFEDPHGCGFTQTNESDTFNWSRTKGTTPSQNTGPSADHTCGTDTGHFMFIEASAKARGANAILYSPMYRGMDQQCVGFHYHMNGKHIGTLNVFAKARGYQMASVWRAYGNQGDWWIIARLAIPKQLARAGYQIGFEGITERGYQGDIAIDDITVEDGSCPVDSNVIPVEVKLSTVEQDAEIMKLERKLKRRKLKKKGKKSRKSKRKNRKRNKQQTTTAFLTTVSSPTPEPSPRGSTTPSLRTTTTTTQRTNLLDES